MGAAGRLSGRRPGQVPGRRAAPERGQPCQIPGDGTHRQLGAGLRDGRYYPVCGVLPHLRCRPRVKIRLPTRSFWALSYRGIGSWSLRRLNRLCEGTGLPYDITYRIKRKDGDIRVLHSVGAMLKDASGRVWVRMYGTNQDITGANRPRTSWPPQRRRPTST